MSSTSSLLLHNNCLICGSTKIKTLEKFTIDHLCKCSNCAFVFSRAIPSKKLLEDTYKNYGSAHHHVVSALTRKRYDELLSTFAQYRHLNKILDVGCGSGHFLVSASEHGWEVYGSEFSESLYDLCKSKQINMTLGSLDPEEYESGSFDVLTSFEVIEHINNPLEELDKFYRLLRPGGVVYCTTPNFNAIQRLIKGQKFRTILSYPEHLSYFTPRTLSTAFETVGFKVLNIESTGIALNRTQSSKNPISTNRDKRHSPISGEESTRVFLESSAMLRLAKRGFNSILTALGTGLTIKATYIKPLQ
jgi:2-polyprenyl-3-methyl-5-hydroxy-6-metoxy-1,4-benzoquinol methylase